MPTINVTSGTWAQVISPGPNDQTLQVTTGRVQLTLGSPHSQSAGILDLTAPSAVISVPSGMSVYARAYSPGQVTLAPSVITTTVGAVQGKSSGYSEESAFAAANGIVATPGITRANTQKIRSAMASRTRNPIIACIGPSTVAGQTVPVTSTCAQDSWPFRLALALTAMGIPASPNSFFGAHAGYGATNDIAGVKAGDSRITSTGATALNSVSTVGGNAFRMPTAASTLVFTPTTNVTKWKVYTRNNGTGRNLTAVSGSSGSVAINSTSNSDITETIVNAGTAGLNALTLTWVAGDVTILGAYGYDDTGGKQEIVILNWGISGAISSRFNEDADGSASTMKATNKIAPDLIIGADLPINDWRTSIDISTSKTAIAAVSSSRPAASDMILATPLWDGSTTGLASSQDAYSAAVSEVASEQGIGLVDNRASWVSYAAANALGWYGDTVHPTALGYNVEAMMWSEIIRRIRSM